MCSQALENVIILEEETNKRGWGVGGDALGKTVVSSSLPMPCMMQLQLRFDNIQTWSSMLYISSGGLDFIKILGNA